MLIIEFNIEKIIFILLQCKKINIYNILKYYSILLVCTVQYFHITFTFLYLKIISFLILFLSYCILLKTLMMAIKVLFYIRAYLHGGIGKLMIPVLLGFSGFLTGLGDGVLKGLSFTNVFKSST